ncbi:ABC transporter ATP-binding protein [Tepidimicrobium xylanilyticum]|uniref:Iron complex transport system ATP-binding protein n=1 Tax=Tepidimicrobium xylanilyticum TaxID=1123352 RepID=A0A1H2TJ16_9FIRM|nr:ABC transporter ATP-binding protein [Tepidimicrobium xylanilyticum]GMG95928.1 ABC transporter ATP-binding protein [Tepidimicrobium xylanilyticum]SDW43996.1 iron complex transport system ATP-binding protein [Tepidimicrobium xylanilyticum]
MVIRAENLYVNYGEKEILKDICLKVEKGQVVSIIGPNGSGKSTLIKVLSRCIKPAKGNVYLEDENILRLPTKLVAKRMAILPQFKNTPNDITVRELVSYGRYPRLKFGQRLGKKDYEIIDWAIEKTGIVKLKDRHLATLSGGEQQRAWLAMSLAQQPEILLLDEPTTFLDISYQLEILQLVKELNETLGLTVLMVLHDLNQAFRFSDSILVLKDGQIWEYNNPNLVLNERLLKEVFNVKGHIYRDEINRCPYFIPYKAN